QNSGALAVGRMFRLLLRRPRIATPSPYTTLVRSPAALAAELPDLEVRHQTGRDRDEPVRAAYAAAGFPQARVEPFIDDVAAALLWADLIVARAGATTVAELACVGRPALFVPFPHAADDHQTANARSLVDHGAAEMAREETLDQNTLIARLRALLADRARLAEMGQKARERGRPEAARAIVLDLLTLAGRADLAPVPARLNGEAA
ncbi:MAG: hypothetical protein KC620_14030, partial [Myxococcales bacterium]|nr:hypothetical protein [Myxococcales bacterium]